MTVPDKKTGKTKYQSDAEGNGDARYMAAFLQMNKWDIKSLERMVETKKVGELKGKLNNFTDTRAKMRSPSSNVTKDDNNPFSGFEKLQ